ncbi:hypothetical protein GCM10007972_15850 [Iodidimonas muriae]|uniref:Dienelactone hydrolase domain-containing protein n=1 Tax=Iodidimonas muriae TaxID=261467 RepID=A0ABQ2LD41_9PROT|nr:alpha/beta hydrolase-fold protein [Iodidimonas muriae]GER07954.1 hypothetical protein JCM17843_22640 [Kordiimonadales bacterium JCM 17843]GGO11786.1 hypothetical protein GCM10007972_15850 [Iodidimonas muriae]
MKRSGIGGMAFAGLMAFSLCSAVAAWAAGPSFSEGQHAYEYGAGDIGQILVSVPAGALDGGKNFPLLVFLHGSGERGEDITRVKVQGPPKLVEERPDFPFIVVSPQLAADARWKSAQILDLVDWLAEKLPVDEDRLYLTGLSLGGTGTWRTAIADPKRFAAIAPIAGRSVEDTYCVLASLPVWAFHGARDDIVDPGNTVDMVAAIEACGGRPGFTLYPDANHNSWTRTYESEGLYQWLLSHRKRR